MKQNKLVLFAMIIMITILMSFAIVPALPVHAQAPSPGQSDMVADLATWQVWAIGLISSLLVSLVKWLAQVKQINLFGKVIQLKPITLNRFWLTLILLLVAGGLVYWWFPINLPALPVLAGLTFGQGVDVAFNYAGQLVRALMPYVGSAMTLYNLLLNYFTDPEKRSRLWQDLKDWFLKQIGMPEQL
jgi:hypothetical protein